MQEYMSSASEVFSYLSEMLHLVSSLLETFKELSIPELSLVEGFCSPDAVHVALIYNLLFIGESFHSCLATTLYPLSDGCHTMCQYSLVNSNSEEMNP
jgi:hypothetical protein